MAKALKVGQGSFSRHLQRSDMLLSTLQRDARAMGGELQLLVTLPNRKPVTLKSLRGLAN